MGSRDRNAGGSRNAVERDGESIFCTTARIHLRPWENKGQKGEKVTLWEEPDAVLGSPIKSYMSQLVV